MKVKFETVERDDGGITTSERLLGRLCRHSFLSMWSYSNLFIDKGDVARGGDGQEFCDLVVVFDNTVILFSDKECKFGDSGNLAVDWSRWYRSAIKKSADQIFGAERWLRKYPNRIFTDKRCTQTVPIALPQTDQLCVHRVVVANGASSQCRAATGGSGSLMLNSGIAGDAHCLEEGSAGKAFTIGQIDPKRGFVHVFDDTSLPLLLSQLDTITDFVAYLGKKESLLTSGRLVIAAGEENILARYLMKTNAESEHDFILSDGSDAVQFEDGVWNRFQSNPQRLRQIEADKSSYFWDFLIEKFTFHAVNGTSEWPTDSDLNMHEMALRFLAKEPRLRRRYLTNAFIGMLSQTPSDYRATRVVAPYLPGQPHYLFLVLPFIHKDRYAEYRKGRRELLLDYCLALKADVSGAQHIVAIATESRDEQDRTEDLICVDVTNWMAEDQRNGEEVRRQLREKGFLTDRSASAIFINEYPDEPNTDSMRNLSRMDRLNGKNRNLLCPCGSMKKYKKCCGPLVQR